MHFPEISPQSRLHARASTNRGHHIDGRGADIAFDELGAILDEARGVGLCGIVGGDGVVDRAAEPGVV